VFAALTQLGRLRRDVDADVLAGSELGALLRRVAVLVIDIAFSKFFVAITRG